MRIFLNRPAAVGLSGRSRHVLIVAIQCEEPGLSKQAAGCAACHYFNGVRQPSRLSKSATERRLHMRFTCQHVWRLDTLPDGVVLRWLEQKRSRH
eukprot:1842304-Prymnesium_polylepis.1